MAQVGAVKGRPRVRGTGVTCPHPLQRHGGPGPTERAVESFHAPAPERPPQRAHGTGQRREGEQHHCDLRGRMPGWGRVHRAAFGGGVLPDAAGTSPRAGASSRCCSTREFYCGTPPPPPRGGSVRTGGGGVWDPKTFAPTMARPDSPNGKFRFPP